MFCLAPLSKVLEVDMCAARIQFEGFCAVKKVKGRQGSDFWGLEKINEDTICVQIQGYPFLWVVKEILSRAPYLQVIEVLPGMVKMLSHSHYILCEARKVVIIPKYPQPCWRGHPWQNRSTTYDANRVFFLTLTGEKKQLFEELLVLGVRPALLARDYYYRQGLKDEKFSSQYELGLKYGYYDGRYVSVLLNALRYYLDSTFSTSRQAMVTATMIAKEVARLHTRAERERKRATKEGGCKRPKKEQEVGIPEGLPERQRKMYELVREAEREGVLDILKTRAPKKHTALTLCFGVTTGRYISMREAAGVLGCTRQNVWLRVSGACQFIKKELATE